MNWIQKWITRRRVNDLKAKIEEMKSEAQAAEEDHLMLSACTITDRIRLLEKAVEKIELQQTRVHPSA